MRVLVCGDKDWTNEETIREVLKKYCPSVIIEGECRGADRIAKKIGEELGAKIEKYPAEWKRFGKGAGPVRNQQMLNEGDPVIVIAFHDDLAGRSKGTANMVGKALDAGLSVLLVNSKGEEIWMREKRN